MKHRSTTSEERAQPNSSSGMTRRNCIRSIGAGTAAVGGLSVSGSVAAQETKGRMVFVYDDGYVEDYTQTFTIHQQFDAPACAAVPSSAVGRNENFLKEDQLTEMSNAGWEVMSHAVAHECLGSVTLTEPAEPGDTRLYVDSTVHGRTPNEAEIFQGDKRVVRKITGKDQDDVGGYLRLDSKVGQSFQAEQTKVRFTEDVVRRVLEESKASLEQRGFDVNNFVYPYGRYDNRTEKLVTEYYNAVANAHPGGLNTRIGLDPYDLRREYFHTETMTKEEMGTYMDRVASRDTLGLFGGHSRNPNLPGRRIQTAIEMAQERNLEIVTLQQALEDFGVYESTPTPTATPGGPSPTSPTATPTPNGNGDGNGGGVSFIQGLLNWLASLF